MSSSQPRRIGASMNQIDEGAVAGEKVEQATGTASIRGKTGSKPSWPTRRARRGRAAQKIGLSRPASTVPPMKKTKPRKPSGPAVRNEMQRPAGMDQQGLHVALDPARALADPLVGAAARLFESGRVDNADAIALVAEPDAKIGVLGDIEGVPAVQLAQHVGPENGWTCRQAGSACRAVRVRAAPEVEPERIVEREHAREPVLVDIVVVEAALQAGGIRRRAAEGRHHLAQLVGLGPILGVVDDQDILRARSAVRNCRLSVSFADREGGTMMISNTPSRPSVRADFDGFVIVGLKHDLDVELAKRIVEIPQRLARRGSIAPSRNIGTRTREDRQILAAQRARFDCDRLVGIGGAACPRSKPECP